LPSSSSSLAALSLGLLLLDLDGVLHQHYLPGFGCVEVHRAANRWHLSRLQQARDLRLLHPADRSRFVHDELLDLLVA
jgi:hypothetical protein